jgi:hypothetical protein
MRKISKILSIILAILMMISIIPITASAATYSGACGDNVTWTYDDTICTLTISGTGTMYDYKSDNRPWESYEDKIKTVIINDGVTTIGDCAFYSFGKLERIVIPESIYAIGRRAFNSCKKITSITMPYSVTVIEERAFMYCDGLTNVVLPNNITSIDEWAFAHCVSLTNITIPQGVTSIGNRAFYCCESLENITIPKGVTTFGDNVFSCCYSLQEINIPDGVISIGKNAFSACKNLTKVRIPASVTTIGQLTFSGCANLTSIMVDSENKYYSTNESSSVLFNKDKTTLILYLRKNPQTSYDIPDTVKTISDSAFIGCQNLTLLTISKNVETIGDNAFESCFGLTNLIIPDNVKTIGDYAFYNCFNLESVKFGNGVTSIGKNAFSFNDYFYPDEELQLKELELGNSVTRIDEFAFCNCELLTSVTIPVSVKTIEYGAFIGCNNIEDVYYGGSQEQWEQISIAAGSNKPLLDATIHYNYHIHEYNPVVTDPTCTEKGYTTYTCECGDSYVANYVDALGHTEETIPAVAPSCNETGLTEGSKCSVCDEILTEQKELPATGHTPANAVEENYASPTCTENGSKDVVIYCSVCDEEISRDTVVINATGHSYTTVITAPTCIEQGYTTYTCSCGDNYVDDYVNATGHADNDGDGYCDACNEQLEDNNDSQISIISVIMRIINFLLELLGIK